MFAQDYNRAVNKQFSCGLPIAKASSIIIAAFSDGSTDSLTFFLRHRLFFSDA
jgi:hypothetical protein